MKNKLSAVSYQSPADRTYAEQQLLNSAIANFDFQSALADS
jgi:hypothetical protein